MFWKLSRRKRRIKKGQTRNYAAYSNLLLKEELGGEYNCPVSCWTIWYFFYSLKFITFFSCDVIVQQAAAHFKMTVFHT